MQNDLRQTGQKHCICMRNNMHKLRPEIMDYSVWLKKRKSMESCVQLQRSNYAPVLRHICRQFSPRSLGWLDAGPCAPTG